MNGKIAVVDVEGIEEGMLAADDVLDFTGAVIVHKGMELEGKHMRLFKRALVNQVRVLIPETKLAKKDTIHITDYQSQLAVLQAARVMVVDDSKFMRFKLEKSLAEAGLSVVGSATNGKEAVETAEKLKPTVVTMDVEMPNFDGISALPGMKLAVPEAVIIMISSVGEEDRILEALAKGAVDFINKPIDPVATVRSIINAILFEKAY